MTNYHETFENSQNLFRLQPSTLHHQASDESHNAKRRKTLSLINCNIGPILPESLLHKLKKEYITHLNLHSNSIKSLNIDSKNKQHVLDLLEEIDFSSNLLGSDLSKGDDKNIHKLVSSSQTSYGGNDFITILSIAPNLISINLSANNLTNKALQKYLHRVVMPHLTYLDLSNNNLSHIPRQIMQFCPQVVHLNLFNNLIQDLTNLEQLSNCDSLQRIKLDANPLCFQDLLYKEKVICFFGLRLSQCDDLVIDDNIRYEARAKLASQLDIVTRDEHDTGQRQKRAASLHKSSRTKDIAIQQTNQNELRNNTTNNQNQNLSRETKAIPSMALHKLNSLETQVQKLSELAVEQIKTTSQFMNSQSHGQPNKQIDRNESDKKRDQIKIVCNASAQTMIDSVEGNKFYQFTYGKSNVNYFSMALALLKWKCSVLNHRKMNDKRKEKNDSELIDMIKKMIEAQHCMHGRIVDSNIKNFDKAEKNDDIIPQLKHEIFKLNKKINRKKTVLSEYKHKSQLEQEQIRSELETNRVNQLSKVNQENEKTLREIKESNEEKLRQIKKVSIEQSKLLEQAQTSLEKKDLILTQKDKDIQNLQLETKKTMEILLKRSNIDKVKLDHAKSATQEAVKLARSRLVEIKSLTQELNDTRHVIDKFKSQKNDAKYHISSLQKSLEEIVAKEHDFVLKMQKNESIIASCHDDINRLKHEKHQEQEKRKHMQLEIDTITKERDRALEEILQLKKTICTQRQQTDMMQHDNGMKAKLCNKILQQKELKIRYKDELKRMEKVVKSLNHELKSKESTILSLTIELNEVISSYENARCKLKSDFDTILQNVKGEYEEKILYYTSRLNIIQNELITAETARKNASKAVASLKEKVGIERKERLQVAEHLKVVKQSLEEQYRKNADTLDSICPSN